MPRYHPAVIEPKWQAYWDAEQTFATPRMPDGRQKLYALDMFPYPSGDGLHVGHPEGYTATDIVCRAARMQGKQVMHPMGFDAFGLPAEEHAIRTGEHPRLQTQKNIDNFRRQLKMLGFSYDWGRELATTDPQYVRWTQWIFLQIFDTWFDSEQQRGRPIAELPIPESIRAAGASAIRRYQDEHRLAYQSEVPVNWCPRLGTVLANEEVIDGKSERGDHPVERLPLRQWMLRITAYADRLESDLDGLDWPEGIKALQRNWIGRSTGAEVDFFLGDPEAYGSWQQKRSATGFPQRPGDDVLRIYTTRPDTLFGATYMVIAPEHPLVEHLTTSERRSAVEAYCEAAARKSDLDRTELSKHKTGEPTGAFAINPANGQPVPIWVADYVLISYGTGAIMAVPAHDDRDFEFAQQFGLDVIPVIDPGAAVADDERRAVLAGERVFTDDGVAIQSGPYDGLSTADFQQRITADLGSRNIGRSAVNYKLRDWLFSRQRFWGEPFPILHELDDAGQPTGSLRAESDTELPLELPDLEDFRPHGRPEPLLDKAPESWLYVQRDGKRYRRETNTMPQWAGSCWYYLRFLDPDNRERLVDQTVERAWMPVDLYVGGAEHAVLHLLYARFWHKVLFDRDAVSAPEPFARLINQGIILGEVELTGYQHQNGSWVSANEVGVDENKLPLDKTTGEQVTAVRVPEENAHKQGDSFALVSQPDIKLKSQAYKMSKSRGNVVNPDGVVQEYGADSLRLYEMFMGPLQATKPWSMDGVNGVRGFLDRVWRMIVDDRAEELVLNSAVQDCDPSEEARRELNKTIKKVTHDIATLDFNTAIARMMEFTNFFTKQSTRPRQCMEPFVLLLAPFAPHIAEELWQLLGHDTTLAYEPWPEYDEAALVEKTQQIPVQVNGKVRSKIEVPAGAPQQELECAARADARIAEFLAGTQVIKVIAVPGRLINFVIK